MSGAAATAPAEVPAAQPGALRRLARDPAALCAGLFLLAVLLLAAAAPWIAPRDPLRIDMMRMLQPPGPEHWFGTDGQGRDVLSRVLHGLRLTLAMGFAAIAIGGLAGTLIGLLAAFYGRLDTLLMRLMDVLLSFPAILFGLAVAAIIGPGTTSVVIALSVATIPLLARIARGAAIGVMQQDFMTSGRAIGLGDATLIARYLLPNCLGTIFVFLTLRLGQVILLGASLSFLGLGTQPPTPELGTMAAQGLNFIMIAPHATIAPSLVIFAVVLAFNILGDALRDVLDPKLRA
jgi:ABC-type dipeptide/oligopeptide/nickel transport system permease subunit